MFMNGEELCSIEDLKRCFSIEELLYCYESGGLEIWLRKIGETQKAEQIRHIQKTDAFILIEIYRILGLNPHFSEEEIRESVNHQKPL
ncbi:MAG: hypothetical protein K2G36_02745 [Ruminococcus sp.]|nr:hypothetical protein [Ruminococcus sp.]